MPQRGAGNPAVSRSSPKTPKPAIDALVDALASPEFIEFCMYHLNLNMPDGQRTPQQVIQPNISSTIPGDIPFMRLSLKKPDELYAPLQFIITSIRQYNGAQIFVVANTRTPHSYVHPFTNPAELKPYVISYLYDQMQTFDPIELEINGYDNFTRANGGGPGIYSIRMNSEDNYQPIYEVAPDYEIRDDSPSVKETTARRRGLRTVSAPTATQRLRRRSPGKLSAIFREYLNKIGAALLAYNTSVSPSPSSSDFDTPSPRSQQQRSYGGRGPAAGAARGPAAGAARGPAAARASAKK